MKRHELYVKMMLGDLRLGELRKIVKIEGQYTIGYNWLPIAKTRKIGDSLGIWMENIGDEPNILVRLDSVVKVSGGLVRIDVPTQNVLGGYRIPKDHVELKIILEEIPFPTQEEQELILNACLVRWRN